MVKRKKYIKPEIDGIPYSNPLMVIDGSTGADEWING